MWPSMGPSGGSCGTAGCILARCSAALAISSSSSVAVRPDMSIIMEPPFVDRLSGGSPLKPITSERSALFPEPPQRKQERGGADELHHQRPVHRGRLRLQRPRSHDNRCSAMKHMPVNF